jgi:hypothetical protein
MDEYKIKINIYNKFLNVLHIKKDTITPITNPIINMNIKFWWS